jgi:hypothetical protein
MYHIDRSRRRSYCFLLPKSPRFQPVGCMHLFGGSQGYGLQRKVSVRLLDELLQMHNLLEWKVYYLIHDISFGAGCGNHF